MMKGPSHLGLSLSFFSLASKEVRAKTYNVGELVLRSSGEDSVDDEGAFQFGFELVLLLLR